MLSHFLVYIYRLFYVFRQILSINLTLKFYNFNSTFMVINIFKILLIQIYTFKKHSFILEYLGEKTT